MFTDSFWSRENEIVYQVTTGKPSPVARRKAARVKADPIPALLEKREALAAEILTATGRKLTDRIDEMNRVNEQLRDLGYFPKGI